MPAVDFEQKKGGGMDCIKQIQRDRGSRYLKVGAVGEGAAKELRLLQLQLIAAEVKMGEGSVPQQH